MIRIGKTRFVFSTGISTPSSEKFNEVSYLDKSVPQYKVKNVRLDVYKRQDNGNRHGAVRHAVVCSCTGYYYLAYIGKTVL